MEGYFKRNFASTSENNVEDLSWDHAERKRISEYYLNERDEIRRKYLILGPSQPRSQDFPKTSIGNKLRRFNPSWFDLYGGWLEYSVKKNKAFCLFCYLFRDYTKNKGGSDAFVTKGFDTWNKTERLRDHVGLVNSFHNNALKKADYLMRAEQNELVSKVVLDIAPKNNQMVSPKIQKDIVHCFVEEVIESIIQEVDHDVFCLLVDESADVSDKEQMPVVFRFVDKNRIVKERFVGLVAVKETTYLSLKCGIDLLFAKYGLNIKKLRGQGYDRASNMKGDINGLRSLILRESSSAYYVYCFAHQLQLVVVAVAKKHDEVGNFFDMISLLINVVGASCKRKYMIREDQWKKIEEEICSGEIKTEK